MAISDFKTDTFELKIKSSLNPCKQPNLTRHPKSKIVLLQLLFVSICKAPLNKTCSFIAL